MELFFKVSEVTAVSGTNWHSVWITLCLEFKNVSAAGEETLEHQAVTMAPLVWQGEYTPNDIKREMNKKLEEVKSSLIEKIRSAPFKFDA